MLQGSADSPGAFDLARLAEAQDSGIYEVWLVPEFADKGSLEDQMVQGGLAMCMSL